MSSSDLIRWGGPVAMVGGVLWAVGWIPFIIGHGPTHVNQGREVIGLGPDAWDQLSVVPLALIAFGLAALHARQAARAGWPGKSGYALALVGLALWAVANLLRLPPGGILVFAVGMMLFGVGTLRAAALPRFTHIAQGLGWVLLGYVLWSDGSSSVQQPARVR